MSHSRNPEPHPTPESASAAHTGAPEEIRIRWRRYGKHGGRWRAELPPCNGIDSGSIESTSLPTVERMATSIADLYGYRIVKEPRP